MKKNKAILEDIFGLFVLIILLFFGGFGGYYISDILYERHEQLMKDSMVTWKVILHSPEGQTITHTVRAINRPKIGYRMFSGNAYIKNYDVEVPTGWWIEIK